MVCRFSASVDANTVNNLTLKFTQVQVYSNYYPGIKLKSLKNFKILCRYHTVMTLCGYQCLLCRSETHICAFSALQRIVPNSRCTVKHLQSIGFKLNKKMIQKILHQHRASCKPSHYELKSNSCCLPLSPVVVDGFLPTMTGPR